MSEEKKTELYYTTMYAIDANRVAQQMTDTERTLLGRLDDFFAEQKFAQDPIIEEQTRQYDEIRQAADAFEKEIQGADARLQGIQQSASNSEAAAYHKTDDARKAAIARGEVVPEAYKTESDRLEERRLRDAKAGPVGNTQVNIPHP